MAGPFSKYCFTGLMYVSFAGSTMHYIYFSYIPENFIVLFLFKIDVVLLIWPYPDFFLTHIRCWIEYLFYIC